jgi:intermediate peptidase
MSSPEITSSFTAEERAVALIFQRDFERSGIDLPPPQREEFVSLSSQIITLGRQFLVEGPGPKGHVHLPIVRLRESLSESAPGNRRVQDLLEALGQKVSRFTGKVHIEGGTWEAHMLLRYSADEAIRRELYIAGNRENSDNVETLEQLLRARYRLARLVGKESFAALTLSDKMAKKPGEFSFPPNRLTDSS